MFQVAARSDVVSGVPSPVMRRTKSTVRRRMTAVDLKRTQTKDEEAFDAAPSVFSVVARNDIASCFLSPVMNETNALSPDKLTAVKLENKFEGEMMRVTFDEVPRSTVIPPVTSETTAPSAEKLIAVKLQNLKMKE